MTKIPWTDETINPWVGCTKIAEGCKHCYAEQMARRLRAIGHKAYADVIGPHGKWTGRIGYQMEQLDKLKKGPPRMIFMCSMSDPFHEAVPFEYIDKVMAVTALCPQHTIQILTKRIKRAAEYFGECNHLGCGLGDRLSNGIANYANMPPAEIRKKWPLPNLWLGTSISTQPDADKNIPILLQIPAAVRFLSIEPMLEEIYLPGPLLNHGFGYDYNQKPEKIDLVIVGCESGPRQRPCEHGWIRDVIRHCQGEISVFVKQVPVNGKCSKNPAEWPDDLRVQEHPELINNLCPRYK